MKRGRRFVLSYGVLTVSCLCATGCLVPYAFPKLDYVPGYDASRNNVADVRAFRVDVIADQIDAGESSTWTLTPIELRPDGSLPPQTNVSLERGVYVLGLALNFNVARLHTTRVRLYRPGYQLVELEPWASVDQVKWQPATEWAAQLLALENLLSRPAVTKNEAKRSARAAKGLTGLSTEIGFQWRNRITTEFVAAEAERLAASAPGPEAATRLREIAAQLRNPTYLPTTTLAGASTPSLTPKSP